MTFKSNTKIYQDEMLTWSLGSESLEWEKGKSERKPTSYQSRYNTRRNSNNILWALVPCLSVKIIKGQS